MAIAIKRETRRDTNISLDKPIYTISVASEILETHPRTLMMYEHLGLVVPKRTATNRRRFSQQAVARKPAAVTGRAPRHRRLATGRLKAAPPASRLTAPVPFDCSVFADCYARYHHPFANSDPGILSDCVRVDKIAGPAYNFS